MPLRTNLRDRSATAQSQPTSLVDLPCKQAQTTRAVDFNPGPKPSRRRYNFKHDADPQRVICDGDGRASWCLLCDHLRCISRSRFRSVHLRNNATDRSAGVRRELCLRHAALRSMHAARRPFVIDGLSLHRGRRLSWTVCEQIRCGDSGALRCLPSGRHIRRKGAGMRRPQSASLHALRRFPGIAVHPMSQR
jgi:hypothetical protein